MSDLDRWVRRPRPSSAGRRPLVCFPPAGASASFFLALAHAAPPSVDPWALAYPGREVRIGEQSVADMRELTGTIAALLAPALREPAILLGHSMGASVAFEVACELVERRPGRVAHLVVSGRAGPREGPAPATAPPPSDDELVAGLRRLGGTPPEILDDPDMLELLLPPMRDDYRLLAGYEPRWAVLPLAITALVGDEDPTVGIDDVRRWQAVCDGPFDAREVPGGHFALQSAAGEVADVVGTVVEHLGAAGARGA